MSVNLFSVEDGFNFLDWHFRLSSNVFTCTPSTNSYRLFLSRVKKIINNSNYGAFFL
jgi:hypothetical protein